MFFFSHISPFVYPRGFLIAGLLVPVSHDSHSSVQGVVLTCGQNDVGQLGLGTEIMERMRMALVDLADPVTQIVAGGMHTVCLTNTGQVASSNTDLDTFC